MKREGKYYGKYNKHKEMCGKINNWGTHSNRCSKCCETKNVDLYIYQKEYNIDNKKYTKNFVMWYNWAGTMKGDNYGFAIGNYMQYNNNNNSKGINKGIEFNNNNNKIIVNEIFDGKARKYVFTKVN